MSKRNRWGLLDEEANAWECPECKGAWMMGEDGGPEENHYYFCPRCGVRLIEGPDNGKA